MKFTFNQNKPAPYSFLRIDRYLYKFTGDHKITYKLDFKVCEIVAPTIQYKSYQTFQLCISGRFNLLKKYDKKVMLTCLHIIRDFLQKQVTAKVMLIHREDLLSADIFELKGRFDLKLLNVLFEEAEDIYLVREVKSDQPK